MRQICMSEEAEAKVCASAFSRRLKAVAELCSRNALGIDKRFDAEGACQDQQHTSLARCSSSSNQALSAARALLSLVLWRENS